MLPLRCFQVVHLIIPFLDAVAGTLTVTDPSGRNAVTMHETLTLICTISPLKSIMAFRFAAVDQKDFAYVDIICSCINSRDSCYVRTLYGVRTSCTSDISKGLFYLTVSNVTLNDEGSYRCEHVFPGTEEYDTVDISIQVPITSVEMINPVAMLTVTEHVNSEFVCETSMGRPQATIQWYKRISRKAHVIPGDIISTVPSGPGVITRSTLQYPPSRSDHDYRIYCTAYNIDSYHTVVSITQPLLYVQYAAEITSFEIYGTTGDGPYTYEELSTFAFHCVVDSLPGSNITISKDGRPIESGDRVTELGYIVNKGTCTDSGLYSCVGYNEINDEVRPKREIEVFVKCKPNTVDTENNVTSYSDLHEDVILSLEVLAYPSPTQFLWFNRNNDSTWTTLTAGIVTSEFKSTLTIRDLQETDYGQYRILVVNPIGSLVHYFFISKPVIVSAATNGNPGVYIGAGVGGVIVSVAVIVAIVVVVKKRQTSTNSCVSKDGSEGGTQRDRTNSHADSGQMQEYINMDLISEGHGSAQRNEYEDLTTRPRDTNVYDELRGETGNTDGVTEDKG